MAFLTIRSRRVGRARACPRVLLLMYPSRTRGLLPVLKTCNETVERGQIDSITFSNGCHAASYAGFARSLVGGGRV
jgi:hypothetical protein